MTGVTFVAAIALTSCAKPPETTGVSISNAWTRLPAVAGRPGAAYFVVEGGRVPAELIAIESSGAQRVELHEGVMMGNMASMRPVASIPIAPRQKVTFEPGGKHAMIFGLNASNKTGDLLPLTFRFRDGKAISVRSVVLPATMSAPTFVPVRSDRQAKWFKCSQGLVQNADGTATYTTCG